MYFGFRVVQRLLHGVPARTSGELHLKGKYLVSVAMHFLT